MLFSIVRSSFLHLLVVPHRYGISRADCDAFAADSHAKAHAAATAGKVDAEIVTIEGRNKQGESVPHSADEGVRPGTTVETLGKLETLVQLGVCPPLPECPEGVLTAGNASQVKRERSKE